jgi:hypothetical protein
VTAALQQSLRALRRQPFVLSLSKDAAGAQDRLREAIPLVIARSGGTKQSHLGSVVGQFEEGRRGRDTLRA